MRPAVGVVGVLVGMAAWGCSAVSPVWIAGPDPEYPTANYLTGVGHGESREAAEDRAYAAIAKIFTAEIHSRSAEWEKYFQADGDGRTITTRRIAIEQATDISTRKILENVAIAKNWRGDPEGVHYALAVMDRRQAGASLRERITALDFEVAGLIQKSGAFITKLQVVQGLHAAVKNLWLREAYNTELQIINPSGKGSEGGVPVAGVIQELRQYLAGYFRIGVAVEGPHSERIRDAIIEGLNGQGLPVTKGGNGNPDPDVTVRGSVTFEPVDVSRKGPARPLFIRWTAAFRITDSSSGQIIGSISKQGREGHLSGPEAESRALRVAEKEIAGEISRQVAGFIYGEERK